MRSNSLGGETWFPLGDRDLATHVRRTQRLVANQSLSEVTAHLPNVSAFTHAIAPMTDAPVRTIVRTDEGPLPFQELLVRRQCEPRSVAIELSGADRPRIRARALPSDAHATGRCRRHHAVQPRL